MKLTTMMTTVIVKSGATERVFRSSSDARLREVKKYKFIVAKRVSDKSSTNPSSHCCALEKISSFSHGVVVLKMKDPRKLWWFHLRLTDICSGVNLLLGNSGGTKLAQKSASCHLCSIERLQRRLQSASTGMMYCSVEKAQSG